MSVLTRPCGVLLLVLLVGTGVFVEGPDTASLSLRGRTQTLHLYGDLTSTNVAVVSSGDGGWIHLAPHVAERLAAQGFFVVGFDARAYLEAFTSGREALRPEDEPGDYRTLIDFATRGSRSKALLVGVSEGAGLSVLAATDLRTRERLRGVIALGLPNINELGWRWRDALIYITHSVPNEPTFSSAAVIEKVAPFPLAAIHSSNDEFGGRGGESRAGACATAEPPVDRRRVEPSVQQ
jgi:pimeloyl-ACP methyl ester carboxylesterase